MEERYSLKTKKVGIWGFGIVGQSALKYFTKNNIQTSVMDTKELNPQEQNLINLCKTTYHKQNDPNKFFTEHDLILASPGIDMRPFIQYKKKFITELDIFNSRKKSMCIAITGTLGKTTVTSILSKILGESAHVITGGNIGNGMLDLINLQKKDALTVLEVSSFQLEYCTNFAPDLALITNVYPNHLDRHTTFDEYFHVKYKILQFQNDNQSALVALELASLIIKNYKNDKKNIKTVSFFSLEKPIDIPECIQNNNFFWIDNHSIIQRCNATQQKIFTIQKNSSSILPINLVIIIAALYLLKRPLNFPEELVSAPEHRMEEVKSSTNATFYNDSKSTIMESTLAAIAKINNKNIILFLGGKSKGVNRQPYLYALKNKVKYILCFGKEAQQLNAWAQEITIPSESFHTLKEAFEAMKKIIKEHDYVLFSPGGSSYDLFKNYEQRGNKFKELVLNLQYSAKAL